MAKKRYNEKECKVIKVDPAKTHKYKNKYIGVFKEAVTDETNIDEMIGAVSIINAQLLAVSMNDELLRKERDLIIEAFEYATERMLISKKNERKIMENWFGTPPLLFRMGMVLSSERNKERFEQKYAKLSDKQKIILKKILDTTWKTREKRRIAIDDNSIEIQKTVPKQELSEYYTVVNNMIVEFLLSKMSVLIFVLEKTDGDTISALRNIDGEISIVEKEELEWCYSHDAVTGEFIGVSDKEKYIDFEIDL